MPSIVIFL